MGGSKEKKIDTTPDQTIDARKKLQEQLFNAPGGVDNMNAKAPGDMTGTNIMTTGPVSTKFNSGADVDRSMVRDVNAGPGVKADQVSSGSTQSVDALGGANSEFFKNMMSQLQPQLTQQRSEGIAAAKEASGSMTGSGFANRVGSSINRSLGAENATAANFASQAIGMEMQRQQQDAGRSLSAATANQGANLQAGLSNQNAMLTASQANQGADNSFMNALLTRNNQGLQAQGMQLQAETQNQNTSQQTNLTQAQLDQQRKMLEYQTKAGISQGNANNFSQLLGGQATVGVGPATVQQSGGFGGFLGGVAGTVLGSAAGPMGSAIGGKIGSSLFG